MARNEVSPWLRLRESLSRVGSREPLQKMFHGIVRFRRHAEDGCGMVDIVHETARLTAVDPCSGVCEATALAKRSGGQ